MKRRRTEKDEQIKLNKEQREKIVSLELKLEEMEGKNEVLTRRVEDLEDLVHQSQVMIMTLLERMDKLEDRVEEDEGTQGEFNHRMERFVEEHEAKEDKGKQKVCFGFFTRRRVLIQRI